MIAATPVTTTARRAGTDGATASARPKTSTVSIPPKPKELESAARTGRSSAARTWFSWHSGAGSSRPPVGGIRPLEIVSAAITASIAPADASVWPICPFWLETGTRARSSPKTRPRARDSIGSFSGVPVPCAFT